MRLYYNMDKPPPEGWQPEGFQSTDYEVDQSIIRCVPQTLGTRSRGARCCQPQTQET